MQRRIYAALIAAVCAGCAVDSQEESESSSDAIRDANGREVITANVATVAKTSTQDSSQLAAAQKCAVPKGTKITIASPSVIGRHVRGRLAAAIPGCSTSQLATGKDVYLFRDHFDGWSVPATPSPSNLPSCSPQRAAGAAGRYPKALLDTIATAEGTRGRGEDGYNVIFTYKYFSSCTQHPRRVMCSGGLCSDASGRYQFLSTTWSRLGLPSFNPENQERGALKLVSQRGVSVPPSRAMSATEFSNAMDRISYEWASLPPGRYGQPSYSLSAMRSRYCGFAGC
ncbi:MAG: glycoside hydrolase family 104 protein [Myxococcales bacterium]|nr:glycoside hydrolase family 104 protein [Myxococcales bacterium]